MEKIMFGLDWKDEVKLAKGRVNEVSMLRKEYFR